MEQKKLNLIFDTDVGADCDDMMALGYLLFAEKYLNVDIKAITYSNGVPEGIACIRSVFSFFGRPAPVIGAPVREMRVFENYCKAVADRFATEEDRAPAENALTVLRRTLAENDEVIICGVGVFTNLAALIESGPDEISPLSGIELLKAKCKKVVVMAGKFEGEEGIEWNVRCDIPSAQKFIHNCPVPIVFSPHALGFNMWTGAELMKKYGHETPISKSFMLYPGVVEQGARHSFDPATAVYAVEGCKDLFDEGGRGTVVVQDDGKTVFTPDENGLHSLISVHAVDGLSFAEEQDLVANYIDACVLEYYNQFFKN